MLDELTGRGVYYGANASEASQCQGDDVYIVGAANSAGQAALNLARFAKRVVLVVRAATLEATMSQYLAERITSAPNIEVRLPHEVVACRGDGPPRDADPGRPGSGASEEVPSSWLFVFIGASPRTDWLGADVVRDDKGFVVTGQDLQAPRYAQRWPLARAPFTLETSVPGVFAAGDVRLDSMKRVASAVGEGAMSVYLVHRYLATTDAGQGHPTAQPLRRADDEQLGELVEAGAEVQIERGVELFHEGDARGLLVGACRRRHRPPPARRYAKTARSGGWTSPAAGPAGSGPGTSNGVYLATGRGVVDGPGIAGAGRSAA